MQNLEGLTIVKSGRWFRGGVTTCPVHIVQHNLLHGTHDPDDPPELAQDTSAPCFYVYYQSSDQHGVWTEGGAALSLREAVFLAQRKLGPVVQWE
jgi:hypothetical protein